MTEKYNSFTILYGQQYERLFRFALHFVPDHEDCEDILADVFVSIWENWDSLKKIDNLNSYLFTAIKNRCLKFLNKRNYFEEYIEDLHIHLSIDHTTPEALLDSNEITGIIEDALNQLPQRCKLIFLMLKEDNLKYKEVADILGISEKTVQAQQIIAKKKLTEIVGHYIKEALPFKYEDAKKDRMDKAVALSLKSIIALNTKRYDVSRQAAAEIINSGRYELFYTHAEDDDPARNFRDLFRTVSMDGANKERILIKPAGCKEAYFRFSGPGLGQQCTSWPTLDFVNAFETKQGKTLDELGADSLDIYTKDPLYNDNRDPRLYATIVMPYDNTTFEQYTYDPWGEGPEAVGRPNASRSGFMLKKFYDPQDRTSQRNDYMIIRYAEILLNYVECLIETGQYNHADVLNYINDIRKRAGQIPVTAAEYNSEEKVRKLYRRERRIELAFEGTRYMDIRRWDIGEETMNGPIYGAVNPVTGKKVQIEIRQFRKNKNEVWPIPESEILANPNLRQNQGYVGKD